MRKTAPLLVLAATLVAAAAGSPEASRLRNILPAEGLIGPSVVEFRDQAALDPHYFLADETVLGLDGKAEAVFARYRQGHADVLVLAVAYPEEAAAGRAHGRFGRDFFSGAFDPESNRFVEEIESGDFAGIARAGSVLVVVLEAPSRKSCDDLLRQLEANAKSLY